MDPLPRSQAASPCCLPPSSAKPGARRDTGAVALSTSLTLLLLSPDLDFSNSTLGTRPLVELTRYDNKPHFVLVSIALAEVGRRLFVVRHRPRQRLRHPAGTSNHPAKYTFGLQRILFSPASPLPPPSACDRVLRAKKKKINACPGFWPFCVQITSSVVGLPVVSEA